MTEEKLICKECGLEYEPQYLEILNARILRGQGNCPSCAEAAYKALEAKEKAAKAAEIMGIRRRYRSESGIPSKFQNKDFSTGSWEKGWQDKAFKVCWKYAEEFPVEKRPSGVHSLYLWSAKTYGVGKTHLSCAVGHKILDRWTGERSCPRIVFVSEPDLFRQIQGTYSFSYEEKQVRESEEDIIKRLTYCDLLILDDVGKERRANPDFIQRTLFGLIDGRYKLSLPMILTANLDPDGLRRHLEEASYDRIFEMIGGEYVAMEGKSYRREK